MTPGRSERAASATQLDELAQALRHTWHTLVRAGTGCSSGEGTHRQGVWVLGRLHAGPKRMSELAECAEVSAASLTGVVDRLEQRGLVTRSRSDDDRRVVTVELTEEGRAAVRATRREFADRLRAMLSTLSADERDELVRLLNKLNG